MQVFRKKTAITKSPVEHLGIQKAFLQIRVRESYRDALRFHWIKNQDITQIDILTLNVS